MQIIKFGPAGNSETFAKQGHKSSVDAPKWLADMGLSAYEYQCGRGVNIKSETAQKIGKMAQINNISMSIHSPYFINLSSGEEERHEKNIGYVLQSCRVAKDMGAKRVVVHCGGLSKLTREEAMYNTCTNLPKILDRMDEEGYSDIRICMETMGKQSVIGDLDEICQIVKTDERLLPCIDFGHLNARTGGGLRTYDDFKHIFNMLENHIGQERTNIFHSHFSKIEYSEKGEVRHLTLEDEIFGPEFNFLAQIIAKKQYNPTIICESNGVQAEDAVKLMNIYKSEAQKFK